MEPIKPHDVYESLTSFLKGTLLLILALVIGLSATALVFTYFL